MSTATISEPISGQKLYQQRARKALPLLVRQAEAGTTIYYSDLAAELGMPNPRNLNFVLGSIGQTLENLSKAWKTPIPPIQCVVVNRATGLPGEGIGWFLVKKEDFVALPREQQEAVVNAHLERIFAYPFWAKVLSSLSLAPAPPLITKVEVPKFGGSGEGPEHKALKDYVAKHPELVGLQPMAPSGRTEDPLLSGDSLDVSFCHGSRWVAVEVKSHISTQLDVQRGLFQCVKYRAVMKAQTRALGTNLHVRAVLVLGGTFPKGLQPLKNMLGVEVIDRVVPR
jgi:hypothetical protein